MSHTKDSTYADAVTALIDQIRPVITERNLVGSEPKTVRRTIRHMIHIVREDETVASSVDTEKAQARAERKRLLFNAQGILNGFPLNMRDDLIDDAIAVIRVGASDVSKATKSHGGSFPEVSIKDWLPSESRRKVDATSAQPLFVSPGRS